MKQSRFSLSLAFLGLALTFATSLAFRAPDSTPGLEIPLQNFDLHSYQSFATMRGRDAVEAGLSRDLGGDWRVWSWNSQAGTPHIVYGSVDFAAGLRAEADLDAAALRLFDEQGANLGTVGAELHVIDRVQAQGKWVAHLAQTYQGIPVWQGKAFAAFTENGRLVAAGSDVYTDIELSTNPSYSAAQAEQIARIDLTFDPANDTMTSAPELLILPIQLDEENVEHHLVWRMTITTADPYGIWITHVDAHSGEIIWRDNMVEFFVEGDTSSDVNPNTWCNDEESQPVPYLRVSVSGSSTVYSDEDGNWTSSAFGPVGISADLYGNYCNITNMGGAEAQFNGIALDGVPLTIAFNDGNSQDDERDVFNAVSDIHDFFQLVAPEFSLPNQRMSANVSLNDNCNAYWNGSINFFTEGAGCANTGEIQGVVHHEFGHGVQAAILGWQGDQGLGEGNSDVLANLITQEAIIGRGFYLANCETGIRNSDNENVYPDDVIGEGIHYAGQTIAGFHWDIMIGMQNIYGDESGTIESAQLWHYGRVMGHPTSQPDQVFWTFMADDDDGDLDNGTPHYSILCEAATNHGFDCPPILVGVIVEHTPLSNSGDNGLNYPVNATISSTEGSVDPGSVVAYYRHNGGSWSSVGLSTMNGTYFFGEIPTQSAGEVDYYIYAEDNVGTVGTSPWGAPTVFHKFIVAWRLEDMEIDAGWSTAGDAADGHWVRVDPVGTSAQTEDDHSHPGTLCWITGQHLEGEADDYGDVDSGTATLLSPIYDLSQASEVSISYWYWYYGRSGDEWKTWISNDGGSNWTEILQDTGSMNVYWKSQELDLFDFFAQPGQVQLKFEAKDGSVPTLVEGAVDDLMIHAILGGTGVDDEFTIGVPLRLEQNMPNPFNPRTEISFALENSGRVDLKVFDVNGRLVKTLIADQMNAGNHQVVWEGRDQNGRPVGSGVYFYRLSAGGEVKSRSMVLIK